MNKAANYFIEEPIVHAMDHVEDACADAVKSVFNVFSGWFRSAGPAKANRTNGSS